MRRAPVQRAAPSDIRGVAAQTELFAGVDSATPIEGWQYRPEFISDAEEIALLGHIADLALHEARYKNYTARRRIASFGSQYDFDDNRLLAQPTAKRCVNCQNIYEKTHPVLPRFA